MDLIDRTKLPFEIGDEVTYAGDNEVHTIIGYFFSRGFNHYDGSYGYIIDNIITRRYGLSNFCYDEIGRLLNLSEGFYVLPSSLTLITDKNMKEFTKKDLKTGMIVELKDQERYLVLGDTLVGIDNQSLLSYYNEDLTLKCNNIDSIKRCTICKVYKKYDGHWGGGFKEGLHNDVILIWERPKVVELSMEEIANKLGIPVNQLRIKK